MTCRSDIAEGGYMNMMGCDVAGMVASVQHMLELADQIAWEVSEDDRREDGGLTDQAARKIAEHGQELATEVATLDEWRRRGGYDPYIELLTRCSE
jgi:hypothetical protein